MHRRQPGGGAEMQDHKLLDYLTDRVSDLAGHKVSREVALIWARIGFILVASSVAVILLRLGLAGF